ncbi:MAG: hypothetical protein AB9873_20090 [Syntrophobacteraceae bacterium]
MRQLKLFFLVALLLALTGCGGGGGGQSLDQLRSKLDQYKEYSVILADMNSKGLFVHDYFHKYVIVTIERKKDEPEEKAHGEDRMRQTGFAWTRKPTRSTSSPSA